MGSNTDNPSEGDMVHSPVEATKGNIIQEPLDIAETSDENYNEQGHLWMCAACENQPTFDTIYDLFRHKRSHNSGSVKGIHVEEQETINDDCQLNANCGDLSDENEKGELPSFHSTEHSFVKNDFHTDEGNFETKKETETHYGNSPSPSLSSEDIPLASLISKNSKFSQGKAKAVLKNVKEKLTTKKLVNCNSKSDKKRKKKTKLFEDVKNSVDSENSNVSLHFQNSSNVENNKCIGLDKAKEGEEENTETDFDDFEEKESDNSLKHKKKHFCKICNTEFPSRFTLSSHKKTHLFEDTGCYKCETCGKMCPKYDNFTRHLTIHFTNREKSHQCTQCFASFYNLADLKRHLVLHLAVKPYRCEHCGEGFIRQDNLLIHAYKHTGVQYKKFACKDCDKVLNSPSALVMHAKTHSVKTVFCPEPGCKFSCYLQSQLRQHVRKHSGEKPFQCAKCGRCFARSNDMKNHVLNVHEGVRPFKCSSCPKEFALIGNLKIHKITHTNERPYLCAQCGKCFNQSSTLRKHSIIMHNPWRTSSKQNKSKNVSPQNPDASDPDQNSGEKNDRPEDLYQKQIKGDQNKCKKRTETKEEAEVPDKSFYTNSNNTKSDNQYISQTMTSITSACPPPIQEISTEAHVQVPQITVSLPIPLDHSQTFILPTVILEPIIMRPDN